MRREKNRHILFTVDVLDPLPNDGGVTHIVLGFCGGPLIPQLQCGPERAQSNPSDTVFFLPQILVAQVQPACRGVAVDEALPGVPEPVRPAGG